MRKALSEIKKLKKTKPPKPKKIDPKDFFNLLTLSCYSIFQEEDKFQKFCEEEKISQGLAEKLKTFAESKSFLSYIFNPIFAIITDPKYALQIPKQEDAQDTSEKFALVILKNLVEDLKTESIKSVSAKANEIMQNFQQMTEAKMSHDLSQILGDISI